MFHILHILRKKLRNKIKNASLKDIEKNADKVFWALAGKKKIDIEKIRKGKLQGQIR